MLHKLVFLTFVVFCLTNLCNSYQMLGTPHIVSGMVFDDWDANGLRDPLEPGIPNVKVSLWYLPSGVYSVLEDSSKYVKISTYVTQFGPDLNSGKFHFTCLAAGTYKVSVHLSSTRPGTVSPPNVGDDEAIDSDIVSVDKYGMGWSQSFQAEEAGSTHIGIGLVQEIYAVAFSMTGDQTRPEPTVTTTTGTCYAALNKTNAQLYFRIVRGEWSEGSEEEPGGFYQGWDDEDVGYQVRTLNDVSDEKENVWFIPRVSFVDDMIKGRMIVQLRATGSFSDLSRLRGQFSRFRRSSLLVTSIDLSGAYVTPEAVSTPVEGWAKFYLDLERKQVEYELWYSNLLDDHETQTTLNGPASISEEGEVVYEFENGPYKSGKIEGVSDEFIGQLLNSQIYVSLETENYPEGLLRGQIRAWQQVQYQSIIKLYSSDDKPRKAFGEAVFQIDLRKMTVSYYIFYGQLSQDEISATFGPFWLEGDVLQAYRDGVKQGFWYLTSDQINSALGGEYSVEIKSAAGNELWSVVTNWS